MPLTATIYGNFYDRAVTEKDIPKPCSYYDLHKSMSEDYLHLLNRIYNLDFISLRLANVYGPSISESSSKDRGVINQVAKKILNREQIAIYGDGNYYRDYIFIDDVVKAFLLSGIRNMNNQESKVFNICSGSSITLKRLFKKWVRYCYLLLN